MLAKKHTGRYCKTIVTAPVTLIITALLAAAVVAFGTHPNWAEYGFGLDLIYTARRLQWPLVAICLALCVALITTVVAGRRTSWWLLALAPVLALFVYRFSTRSLNAFQILENPIFVRADEADFLQPDEHVVGLVFNDEAYAYPYRLLYTRPVVIQADHDQRMMLLWNAFANRAAAVRIQRDLKGRDLEIVSMPANALLLYNRRLGQFINGLTLRTRSGERPTGMGETIETHKMTWARWRQLHPQTRVMALLGSTRSDHPAGPVLPYYDLPPNISDALPPEAAVAVVLTDPPIAIPTDRVRNEPINLTAGTVPILVLRDKETGQLRAFDRRVEEDLIPRFRLNTDPRRRNVALVDSDTTIGWSATGRAIDGNPERRGFQLTELPVEDNVYWGVMRYWFPNLLLHQSDLLQ